MSPRPSRPLRTHLLLPLVVASLLLAACSGGDGSTGPGDTTATPNGAAPTDALDLGRVLALGEEFLLADLLALGVTPVASTATTVDAGFQGLDAFDTSAIEALPSTEANIERLAALRPDTIVTSQFVVDEVGMGTLSGLAEKVIVVPDGGGAEALRGLAAEIGRTGDAEELLAELDAAREAAAGTATEGCEVSLATIYPGPAPAAWVSGPNNVAIALEDLGCTLSPGPDDLPPDPTSRTDGRVFLSLERLGVLDAPTMVLLQSDTVAGEAESLAEMDDDPLWQQLPAVEAGDVHLVDRLGYPGVIGQIRLYEDLAAVVA